MYKPRHFKLEELVPKSIFEIVKKRGEAWLLSLFDERILIVADLVREAFGPMIANDWVFGGDNQYRGFRPELCNVGSTYSQHKFGRAIDLIPMDTDPDDIRGHILGGQNRPIWEFIGGLELGISWLHIDVRQRPGSSIFTFTQ